MVAIVEPPLVAAGRAAAARRRMRASQPTWARRGSDEELTLWPLSLRYIRYRIQRDHLHRDTIRGLSSRLYGFSLSFGRRPLEQLGPAAVARWLEETAHLAPASRRNQVGTVRAFSLWLVRQHLVAFDPTADVGRIRQPRRVPRALNREIIYRILEACEDSRETLLVCLMRGMGLRCVEVAGAEVGDYDREGRTMLVRGKAGHERLLPVPAETSAALSRYLSDVGHVAGPLIRSQLEPSQGISKERVSQLVGEIIRRSGVKVRRGDGISAHALRHTAASDVLDACGDLTVVQQMLGHANLQVTSVYLRTARLGDLREAMEAAAKRSPAEAQVGDAAADVPVMAGFDVWLTSTGRNRVVPTLEEAYATACEAEPGERWVIVQLPQSGRGPGSEIASGVGPLSR